ncbi:MAG: hypothetical protein ACM3PD_06440, partial [Chloroflexota bacterium]
MSLTVFKRASAPQDGAPSDDRRRPEHDPGFAAAAQRFMYRLACATPPAFREPIAEAFLRRASAPGPAAEHAFQRALGLRLAGECGRDAAVVAKAADNFYARQYRQLLNPVMGVFAATATLAVLGAGRPPRGLLWRRHRPVEMAMAETVEDAGPILVLDRQTVATPVYLPLALNLIDWGRLTR